MKSIKHCSVDYVNEVPNHRFLMMVWGGEPVKENNRSAWKYPTALSVATHTEVRYDILNTTHLIPFELFCCYFGTCQYQPLFPWGKEAQG